VATAVAAGAAACTGSGARAALPTQADLAALLAADRDSR
jgi:sugar/nucleoside kinase (ribokinase family)